MKLACTLLASLILLLLSGVAEARESDPCVRSCAQITVSQGFREIVIRGGDGSTLSSDFQQSDSLAGPTKPEISVVPLDELDTAGTSLRNNVNTNTVTHILPGGGSVTIVSVFLNGTLISQTMIIVSSTGVIQVHHNIV